MSKSNLIVTPFRQRRRKMSGESALSSFASYVVPCYDSCLVLTSHQQQPTPSGVSTIWRSISQLVS